VTAVIDAHVGQAVDLPTRPVIVANVDDLTDEEWLDLRRRGIGGSDAGAVAGLGRWSTPLSCWLDKTGDPLDDDAGEAARWGTLLEPIVRDEVARREGVNLRRFPYMLAHPERPWQQVNLDGLWFDAHDRPVGVYEGKTANQFASDGWDDDGVPDSYVLQGLHALDVTGLDAVLFGALIGGQRLVVRYLQRDEQLIEHLRTVEAEFWQRVLDRQPPAPSAADGDLLAHLWDVKADLIVDLGPAQVAEVVQLLDERAAAHEAVKAAEAHKAELDNRLKAVVGEASAVRDPATGQVLVKWPQLSQRKVDLDLLRSAHTQIAESCTKTTTYRRLSIPKRKG